jgi:hypothetical protein
VTAFESLTSYNHFAKEAKMEPIVVSNQAEYKQAEKTYWDLINNSRFDIAKGKGMKAIEVISFLLDIYLNNNASKDDTEKNIAYLNFTEQQAEKITCYFQVHQPEGLHDIERGLNFLGIQNNEDINWYAPLIHIKNGVEKIDVSRSVEVFGKSEVAAFHYAQVAAHDKTRVTAFDYAIVYALDNSNVIACNNSHIIAKNSSLITSFDSVKIEAKDQAVVIARDASKVTARDNALVFIQNNAVCNCYDNANVIADYINKPDYLQEITRYILDHPFVKGDPETAINLLIASSNSKDKTELFKKIRELGSMYPEAVKRILHSQAGKTNANARKARDKDNSWER